MPGGRAWANDNSAASTAQSIFSTKYETIKNPKQKMLTKITSVSFILNANNKNTSSIKTVGTMNSNKIQWILTNKFVNNFNKRLCLI